MGAMPHQHRKHQERNERCFTQAVAYPENRAAHGNITVEHVCRCGAVRLVNVNGRHVERGPWIMERDPIDSAWDRGSG